MIRPQLKQALLSSGVLRLAGRLRGKGAAILMYHSVLEDPSTVADTLGGMIHSHAIFAGQMELLAREFHPVSLDQVGRFVRGEDDLPERAVAVTFDDGYLDNFEMAMPILDRVGVPAAFYVTVDCIESRRLPWPSRLRFSFRKTGKQEWKEGAGKAWNLRSEREREAAFLAACDRVATKAGTEQERVVSQIESDLAMMLATESGHLMMTWEHVRELAQRGHIVGSHTMTHPNLAHVGIEEARRELIESKARMEAQISAKVVHFSYPCPALSPNWTEETTKEAQRAGYATAVTTSNGLARRNDDPLALKRIRPSKAVDGLRWNLETAFAGRVV